MQKRYINCSKGPIKKVEIVKAENKFVQSKSELCKNSEFFLKFARHYKVLYIYAQLVCRVFAELGFRLNKFCFGFNNFYFFYRTFGTNFIMVLQNCSAPLLQTSHRLKFLKRLFWGLIILI